MKIGVDVGGTNTDAVLLAGREVLAAIKCPTTEDVSTGIVDAISTLIGSAAVSSAQIRCVMIGTTHFTNAFVQRRHLEKVLAIRIGYPASRGIPPFSGWPQDVRDVVFGGAELVGGGYEFDGRAIGNFDGEAIRVLAQHARESRISQIAVSCIFSQLNADQEIEAAAIIRQTAPDISVSISSELGRVGLIERENAAIMNASLRPLADKVATAFGNALTELGLRCSWYVSQNDGTLMSAEQLRTYPVLTFAAGPTNSLRGAAWLTGSDEAIVIDVGGTTTDLGVLTKGFPRQSSVHVDVGGVRTNFRMPDVLSIGLGGGSRVRTGENGVTVGPDSVGFELREKALIFGGDELTASDIAVAENWADFGDKNRVSAIDIGTREAAGLYMNRLVSEAVDKMKTSSDLIPAILVGGGSILVRELPPGISELTRPDHAGVANAIGAAIGQVSGEIDRIYTIGNPGERDDALANAQELARQKVLAAGGAPDDIQIVNLEAIPLQYLPGGATRIICRAVGNLPETGVLS